MGRKGQLVKRARRPPRKPTGEHLAALRERERDPLAGTLLLRYMDEHFEWMLVAGYSQATVHGRRRAIRRFIAWIDDRGIADPRQITRPMIERYQRFLFYYRKADGQPLTIGMQLQYLAAIKLWFKWLTKAHHILANPASDLELPRQPKRLPGRILSPAEVEAILAEAEPDTAWGLRDRALLELLYATGLRRSEAASLEVYDADVLRGVLWVRRGKGGRQRVVPLGERCAAWLAKYVHEARPQLLAEDHQALFVTDWGLPMRADQVSLRVKRHLQFAGLDKGTGATHLLRHACATHMLEGGADIRFIQAMLGHAQLSTTEVYTHVSIAKLKEIHAATHPARLERARRVDVATPSPAPDRGAEAPLQASAHGC